MTGSALLFVALLIVSAPVAFLLWRVWRSGAWSGGRRAAFEPWKNWQKTAGKARLIHSAILASNAHNTQPWRFHLAGDTVILQADFERHIGSLDPFRREMHQSIGCALENLVLAARASGMIADVELPAGTLALGSTPRNPAAIVTLRGGQVDETELFRAIPNRHTHRGAYRRGRNVPQHIMDEMQASLPSEPPIRLFLFVGRDRDPLADLIVASTKAIVADGEMSKDNAQWFRFHEEEIARHRDGLTLDATVPSPIANLIAKMFPPSASSADSHWLTDTENVQLKTAALLGMITVRTPYDRPTAIWVGRVWQRLHLLLVARGLDAQPINQPIVSVSFASRSEQRGRLLGSPEIQSGFRHLSSARAMAGANPHPARVARSRPCSYVDCAPATATRMRSVAGRR